MKAIISSTYDDQYLFNLPIVTWAWKQLGVEVECFFPNFNRAVDPLKTELAAMYTGIKNIHFFNCPPEKTATYAQVSRLFACCLNLPKDEVLITSDVDMLPLKIPLEKFNSESFLTVLGTDLTPANQYPMCYAGATVKTWRKMLTYDNESYQEMLDKHLGHENCENMRGNLWSRDQELLYIYGQRVPRHEMLRARSGTQFADNRCDRDDSFWEERLNDHTVDAHLWRPLWEPVNFEKLLKLLRFNWPEEDFQWVIDYRDAYVKLM